MHNIKKGALRSHREIFDVPVRFIIHAVTNYPAGRPGSNFFYHRVIKTGNNAAILWHYGHQLHKGLLDSIKVSKDISMIKFY